MICNVLIFKNKKLGAYTQPIFDDHNPDVAATQFGRSLVVNPDVAKKYKGLSLYHIGTFDDTTAKITTIEPVMLIDCDDVIAQSEGGEEDGKEEAQ